MLRDFFIIGINDDSILRKLLTESDPNLAKVMEIATVCMQTAESLRVISNKSKVIQQDPSVNKVTFGFKFSSVGTGIIPVTTVVSRDT